MPAALVEQEVIGKPLHTSSKRTPFGICSACSPLSRRRALSLTPLFDHLCEQGSAHGPRFKNNVIPDSSRSLLETGSNLTLKVLRS